MLVLLFAFKFLLGAEAFPVSTGLETRPTIAHFVLWGILPRSDSSSTERSLYEIIRSCLITITICVYRAVHQNVPDPAAGLWKRMGIKFGIAVLTLLAPELVLWWAIRQWFGARAIANLVNEVNPSLKWTWTHGQFAQMGGFGIVDNHTKRIVRPLALIDYLKTGQVDAIEVKQITTKEINDHSKGDLLSKAILAFQTSGFAFECLARLHQKLPITELEVVTLAFATLNIFTYLFWWCKPLDVLCPIYFQIQSEPEKAAPSSVDSPSSPAAIAAPEVPLSPIVSTESENSMSPPTFSDSIVDVFEYVVQVLGPLARTIDRWVPRVLQLILVVPLVIIPALAVLSIILAVLSLPLALVAIILSLGTAILGGAIAFALAVALPTFFGLALGKLIYDNTDSWDDKDETKYTYAPIFYAMKTTGKASRLVWPFSCFLGMIFGAIHFISWHSSSFHTHIESLLWRISSVGVVAIPFCVSFLEALGTLVGDGEPENRVVEWVLTDVAGLMIYLSMLFYAFARVCIVVLAFLTLRHLPPGAFETVSWTIYVPHF